MIKLRDYQLDIAYEAISILDEYKIAYLAMEMRTGKTLTALEICKLHGFKKVLFITPKKAIASIQRDYEDGGYAQYFELFVHNYEYMHKFKENVSITIVDEAHLLGAFPKPSLRTKRIKAIVKDGYLLLLSGTPTPESYSQIYHQLWLSKHSPFTDFKNFYQWAKMFVNVKSKRINGYYINDYSDANMALVSPYIEPLMITYSQEEAGFEEQFNESIVEVKIRNSQIKNLINTLIKDKYAKLSTHAPIVCDSAVKLQSKIHQLSSGTYIDEELEGHVIDKSKAEFIKDTYSNKKIVVFYKYKMEEKALRSTLSGIVSTPEEFNTTDGACIYISQIKSGSMGINLSTADYIIYYNIDFSYTTYKQSQARASDKNRTEKYEVVYLFSDVGIEKKIYKAVTNKHSYTNYYFKRDYKLS